MDSLLFIESNRLMLIGRRWAGGLTVGCLCFLTFFSSSVTGNQQMDDKKKEYKLQQPQSFFPPTVASEFEYNYIGPHRVR